MRKFVRYTNFVIIIIIVKAISDVADCSSFCIIAAYVVTNTALIDYLKKFRGTINTILNAPKHHFKGKIQFSCGRAQSKCRSAARR